MNKQISIGRTANNGLVLADSEVSGRHVVVKWNSLDRCWQVSDEGSLNGTLLNSEPISVPGRQKGQRYRLSSDDILQLGSYTKIKVSTFPRDLLDPQAQRHGSLPVGSMPRSLTMPKQRIPSFTLLPSPKASGQQGQCAAACS